MAIAPSEVLPTESLLADGWKRRFLAAPDRVEEVVTLYLEMGFEVHVEQLSTSQLHEACGDCAEDVCRSYVLIYTRKAEKR